MRRRKLMLAVVRASDSSDPTNDKPPNNDAVYANDVRYVIRLIYTHRFLAPLALHAL